MNNGCGQLGAIQTRGTCWFYSILNGFILSEDGQKILYNRLTDFYKKLKPDERSYFDDKINAPCPMKNMSKTKEIYFWKFIDQYLCFMSGPRATTLKTGKSASILKGMSLEGTVAQDMGGKGAFPQAEIENILDHVGFKDDYYVKYANNLPGFHASRKPQFVVVMADSHNKKNYMEKIPDELISDPKYELVCASLIIANTKAKTHSLHSWHAMAGFVCNGKGYIYDSNQRKVFKCNWWNLTDFKKVAGEEIGRFYPHFKGGKINVHMYAFAIFSRKAFVKDIGVSCLMKYRTKTPDNKGINFTSPNLGRRLNQGWYAGFTNAQVVALKRRWARAKHRESVYINQKTYNSIVNSAKNLVSGNTTLRNLTFAGYKIRDPKNYEQFLQKLRNKFKPAKPLTFTNVKARLNVFTKSSAAERKRQYSLVWKGLPLAQRKVLMHWRDKGKWIPRDAFENKVKPPIKRKPKAASPPKPNSPRTKRATQVRANFEKYWKSAQPENRQVIRNYVAAYKSPSPVKKNAGGLTGAKRNVNALKTAKARKEYKRTRAANLNKNNLKALGKYINLKDREARNARAAKKSVAKK